MGVGRAVTASQTGEADLRNFNNEIIAKMELGEGKWILIGRAMMYNEDSAGEQWGTAKIVHDANVVIDQARIYLPIRWWHCLYVQAGLVANGREIVTLECDTYNGKASGGSLIAFEVAAIDPQ